MFKKFDRKWGLVVNFWARVVLKHKAYKSATELQMPANGILITYWCLKTRHKI